MVAEGPRQGHREYDQLGIFHYPDNWAPLPRHAPLRFFESTSSQAPVHLVVCRIPFLQVLG